jgi:hypothetical protein
MLGKTERRPARTAAAEEANAGGLRLREIIEFGKKALHRKQYAELALDILGLDGVSLPLGYTRQ